MVFVRPHMSAGEFLVGMPEFLKVMFLLNYFNMYSVNSVIRYVLYQFLFIASYHLCYLCVYWRGDVSFAGSTAGFQCTRLCTGPGDGCSVGRPLLPDGSSANSFMFGIKGCEGE